MGRLEGKRIAVLATDGFEQSELTSPKSALEGEGAKVEVIAPHEGTIRGWKEKNWGDTVDVTFALEAANPADYDALMLPGGVMNPDKLRSNPAAVDFVSAFVQARKPIAAICHAPWTLINAGAVDGRRMTSYGSIKVDLINAGAKWTDEPFVIDRGLVTSRNPGDLPVFNEKMIEVILEGPIAEEEFFAEDSEDDEDAPVERPAPVRAAAPKRKKKAAPTTGARAKASARKGAKHTAPRGAKQAPRRRSPKRR
jgi:protease I